MKTTDLVGKEVYVNYKFGRPKLYTVERVMCKGGDVFLLCWHEEGDMSYYRAVDLLNDHVVVRTDKIDQLMDVIHPPVTNQEERDIAFAALQEEWLRLCGEAGPWPE